MTLAGIGLRICSMTSRAIFLSFISVGCTGLTLTAILLPLILNISDFWGLGKRRKQGIGVYFHVPGQTAKRFSSKLPDFGRIFNREVEKVEKVEEGKQKCFFFLNFSTFSPLRSNFLLPFLTPQNPLPGAALGRRGGHFYCNCL
ncbi:MAG: hypothetical protein LBK83_16380 [Treponema sp.]|jgi:hypothetical protein|nr:hypothetical protein [Treponema sp.]